MNSKKIHLRLAMALLVCWIHFVTVFAQTQEIEYLLQQTCPNLPNGTEFSIGIYQNNQWSKYGYRIDQGSFQAIENHERLFEIGSITKTFTASLIMKLIDEGKMKLSDPIQNYLPDPMGEDQFQGHSITIQHLLTHTSGLSSSPSSYTLPYLTALIFSPKNPNRNFKAKHYYRYLKNFELDYIPGRAWKYNNSGYALLGAFVEKVEGITWQKAIQQYLFDPLDMTHSFTEMNHDNRHQLVSGITEKGKKAKPWDMKFINAAGAIKSTLDDLTLYAMAQLHPAIAGMEFLKDAQNPLDDSIRMPKESLWHGNAMGLGWWHNLEDGESPFYWHAGASGGYTSFVGFSPDRNKAVIILSNISSSHPLARGENRIPKPILLGQQILRRG